MQKELVLVFNCGSSSIKFALINPVTGENKFDGLVECIATEDARIRWNDGETHKKSLENINYKDALSFILSLISENKALYDNVCAVGHRVVHGGEHFTESVVIDDKVLEGIRECQNLAPLHNPVNLEGILVAQEHFDLPQVAVFDTSFHQTMPPHAYLYALPYKLYEEKKVRRYGFHGTSHRFVASEAAKILGKDLDKCNFITAHLGNGCSVCAISKGKSIDTSMGLTPLEGLIMGTRSGDLDSSIYTFLKDNFGFDVEKTNEILNKKSGLLGISELDSDMRTLEEKSGTNEKAALAIEMFCYRLAKYIASYATVLAEIDALIFTGGIGENSSLIREKTLSRLGILNFKVDNALNNENAKNSNHSIVKDGSTRALVVKTNEELMIALDTLNLVR